MARVSKRRVSRCWSLPILLAVLSSATRITPALNLSVTTNAATTTTSLEAVLGGSAYYQSNLKPCRPGYDLGLDQNLIRGACANGFCRLTCTCAADCSDDDCVDDCITSPEAATDNSIYTAASAKYNSQLEECSFIASFPEPKRLKRVYLKVYTRSNFTLTLLDLNSTEIAVPIARLAPDFSSSVAEEYDIVTLIGHSDTVFSALKVAVDCSTGDCDVTTFINIQEVAVFADECYETYDIDLGADYLLSSVKLQFYLNTIAKLQIRFSLHPTSGFYDQEADLMANPAYELSSYVEDVTSVVSPARAVRYIHIKSYVATSATVWKEINIEGELIVPSALSCPNECSSLGECTRLGTASVHSCSCSTDSAGNNYTGTDCSLTSCEGRCGEADGFGTCNVDVCECSAGRHGVHCEQTVRCPHNCYGQGECVLGVCNCSSLFYGDECGCEKIFELGHGQDRLSDTAVVTTNMAFDEVTSAQELLAKTLLIDGGSGPLWQSAGTANGIDSLQAQHT
jgi:hypothetical protein